MTSAARSPVLGIEVVSAPMRADRPGAFGQMERGCPFCPGNEAQTPPALVQTPEKGQWDVRVVPNLYPLIGTPATAHHEVVIESARHDEVPQLWTSQRTEKVLRLWLDRLEKLRVRSDVAIALMFRNEGTAAGASLAHPHSQVIGLPKVPAATLSRFADGCPLCSDLRESASVLARSGPLIAWCPSPSAMPWEVVISSHDHQPLAHRNDDCVGQLSSLLHATFAAWRGRGITAGNVILQEGRGAKDQAFHWSLSLHPRVTGIAGFELATGILVNIVPERVAAADLAPWFSAFAPSGR